MSRDSFVGREEEIRILKRYYASPKSEFVAVYGRRRVGKTFLVHETLGDLFDFEFSGMYQASAKHQRKEFQKRIDLRSGRKAAKPGDWFEAFDNLKDYLLSLGKEKVALFLDELPWMDTQKSNFRTALASFWNGWSDSGPVLKLFVCGSATTWMVDKLIGDRGGLYGRITRPIYLAPFSLKETEQYLNRVKRMGYGPKQVLDAYMIFGGIPYYLDMLDREVPLSGNVDALLFASNAPLRTEYEFLFRSLFKDSGNYRRVIEFLSGKLSGSTREEIAEGCGLSGGELSKILRDLVSCDFLRQYAAPRKKQRSQIYRLSDLYSLFYLRFIRGNPESDAHYWTHLGESGARAAWSGYAFEQVCLHHIAQIKRKLGISGILSNAYAWSSRAYTDGDGNEWPGGQIDLIIDRSDGVMNLCEMKYSRAEFRIDRPYAERLRDRAESFRHHEKTKKTLRCTFVTLFGVKPNEYSGIVDDEITLEDLFA